MKKLSSVLALSLVLAMVLGMTAFAAGQSLVANAEPSTDGVKVKKDATQSEITTAETKADAAIAKETGIKKSTKMFTIFFDKDGAGFTEGDITFNMPGASDLFDFVNKKYKALHVKDDGTTETLDVTGSGDNITIKQATGLSPFTFYEVELVQTGETNPPANNNNNTNTNSATPTTPVSPKTGETMPAAVVITLLVLAGAAVVGTKKVIAER